jgi:hypothetical protein
MIVLSTFLENVSQREMEEEFVKQTEVVLRFELKKVVKSKSSYCNDNCFFLELFTSSVRFARVLLSVSIFLFLKKK